MGGRAVIKTGNGVGISNSIQMLIQILHPVVSTGSAGARGGV